MTRRVLLPATGACLLVFVALSAFEVTGGEGVRGRNGDPIGGDFIAFWSASSIVQEGDPAAAYDIERMHAVEERLLKGESPRFPWLYPPSVLLLVSGLATLPFLGALLVWLAATAAALLFTLRRYLLDPLVLLLAVGFPGVVQNASAGQTGFLSAAILAGGLLALDGPIGRLAEDERESRSVSVREFLAGVLLGLITYKPHLAPLVFLALVVARRWVALAGAVASAIALVALSFLVFGTGTWSAFLDNLSFTNRLLFDGNVPWHKMTTVTGAALLAGAPRSAVYALQGVASLAAAGVVAWVWRRDDVKPALRNASLCLGVLLATPYAFDYDMVVLGLALLWLGLEAQATGWRAGERETLAFAWFGPFAFPVVASATGVSLMPVVIAGSLWLVVRRVRSEAVAAYEKLPAPDASRAA